MKEEGEREGERRDEDGKKKREKGTYTERLVEVVEGNVVKSQGSLDESDT